MTATGHGTPASCDQESDSLEGLTGTERISVKAASAGSRWDYVLVGLLTVSVAANLVQALILLRQSEPKSYPAEPPVTVAQKAPALYLVGSDGKRYEIPGGDRPSVVYFFSPSCIWCERNLTSIRALRESSQTAYSFVGVSVLPLTDGQAIHATQALGFSVYEVASDSRQILGRFGVRGTPHTIVIAPDSTILADWSGAYTGVVAQNISKFFGVELPPLSVAR